MIIEMYLGITIGFFFGLFCLCLIVLYKPKKYLVCMDNVEAYHNIKGGIAAVYSHDLKGDNLGEIKWSGAICRAQLAPSSKNTSLKKGDDVTIISVKNNIFIVDKQSQM